MTDDDIDLVGVVFDGADKLQHLCWRFLDPELRPSEPTAWEQEIIDLCEQYFRGLDAMLADLVALGGEEATVVVVSDHGFGPSSHVFYLNVWLEQQGFLAWKDSPVEETEEEAPRIGFAQMTRHVYELDWDRTVAYAATPTSMGINIVDRAPGAAASITGERHRQITENLVTALRTLRHPTTGRPLVTEVHERTDTFAGPYEQLAPDLTLTLDAGVAISILRSDTLFREREIALGNHRWDGIFIASGPGIRTGERIDEVSLLDIAPLVLYSQDLPIPTDVAGQIPEQALRPDQLERRKPRWIEPRPLDDHVEQEMAGVALDSDAEATIMSRLRALGYVE